MCEEKSLQIHPSRKTPWTKVALHFTSDSPKVEKVDPHAGPLGERTTADVSEMSWSDRYLKIWFDIVYM